ncbi:PH domain-containing protein [Halobiforma nitratireducens]|uniref:YdbS-like PH domain-containing protein n=1 Tax=Halobiforma nitratireducens JCM 10879 TaxID=1227454 RepID=M0M0E8_9EURY|nr:PH domain-containing protein [Halobiforma nitratireducens]EMA37855.1 hypothetical protein C446_10530 [Halobiforma nitratireducens JCM 10879]
MTEREAVPEIDSEDSEGSGSASGSGGESTTANDDERDEQAEDETNEKPVTVAFGDDPSDRRPPVSGDLRYETTPMLRPVVVMLASVLVVGSAALAVPLLQPELFGDPVLAEIVLYAVAVLVTVTVIRYGIRLVVLARTTYEIREDALVRRYNLAYKRTVRKIPISKLRGHEFTQSRYQAWLDVGTIRLLTAGTNRSLGFLAFEHLKDPEIVEREVRTLLAEREE